MPANENPQHPACPLCEGHMKFKFSAPFDYRKPRKKKKYKVYWCSACHYGNVWKRPQAHEIAGFYQLGDYYTHHAGSMLPQINEQPSLLDRIRMNLSWRLDRGEDQDIAEVTDYSGKGSNSTILEIGCGNGNNLVKFRDAGFVVTGIEPDDSARSVAKKTTDAIYKGTAENLPEDVKHTKFDIILMSHVLEHCRDVNLALSNVSSLLKEKGLLILEVPNCRSMGFELYLETWPWTDIPRHLNFFTPESLRHACKKHGLNILSTKYTGFFRQFSTSWLQTEEKIWRVLNEKSVTDKAPNFRNRSWKLLFRSLYASKERKYDSVRILATQSGSRT